MDYVKIMIAVVWLISLADALGLGAGAVKAKKSSSPTINGSYLKGVGAFNILVGVIATVVLQIFFVNSWTGPGWLLTVALAGGFINILAGFIMIAIGIMMYP